MSHTKTSLELQHLEHYHLKTQTQPLTSQGLSWGRVEEHSPNEKTLIPPSLLLQPVQIQDSGFAFISLIIRETKSQETRVISEEHTNSFSMASTKSERTTTSFYEFC